MRSLAERQRKRSTRRWRARRAAAYNAAIDEGTDKDAAFEGQRLRRLPTATERETNPADIPWT